MASVKIHENLAGNLFIRWRLYPEDGGLTFRGYFSKALGWISAVGIVFGVLEYLMGGLDPGLPPARAVGKSLDFLATTGIFAAILAVSAGLLPMSKRRIPPARIIEAFSEEASQPGLKRLIVRLDDGVNVAYTGAASEVDSALAKVTARGA
jgi:hypothetical protein